MTYETYRHCHWGVQSRFCVIYVSMSHYVNKLPRRNYVAHAHAQSHFWLVKTDLWHLCYWFRLRSRAALSWRKRNVHLEMRNLEYTELQRRKIRGKKGWGLRIRCENEKIENYAVHFQKIEVRWSWRETEDWRMWSLANSLGWPWRQKKKEEQDWKLFWKVGNYAYHSNLMF